MYAVAVSQGNAQVALAFQFLHEVRCSPRPPRRPPRCARVHALLFLARARAKAVRGARALCAERCVLRAAPQVVNVLKSYFGAFDEESLRNNFVLIYELLDEVHSRKLPNPSTAAAAAAAACPRC